MSTNKESLENSITDRNLPRRIIVERAARTIAYAAYFSREQGVSQECAEALLRLDSLGICKLLFHLIFW